MSTLRAAVVGVGYLGRFHAQKYRALAGVDLVGVCDLDAAAGGAVAQSLGTAYFADHRELVGKVDAVTIAASTSAHFELARFFLENGVHVLVEKPMTRTSAEAAVLTELADRRKLKLQVGHVERFNPALLSLVDAAPVDVSAVGIPVLTDDVDIANARIEFANAAIANVTASRVSTGGQRRFRVFQANQYVAIDFGSGEVRRVTL